MANVSNAATKSNLCKPLTGLRWLAAIRVIMCGNVPLIPAVVDLTSGNPAPSLRVQAPGKWRFRWAVKSGSRSIMIDVKQVSNTTPRPSVIVKANTAIGVNSDVTGTAGAGTGWVTIGPIAVTPSSDGALWVELWNNNPVLDYTNSDTYWDNVVVT